MYKNKITKFNPKFQNDNLHAEENFCNQLKEFSSDEYYDYLHIRLDYLKARCASLDAEVYLLDFQKERNHPDEDVYDDYNNPSYANCEYFEECIEKVETEIKQLDDEHKIMREKEERELKVA